MRQPPDSSPIGPLAKRGKLWRGDVRALLRPSFWPAARFPTDVDGEAVAAGLALQAVVGIPDRPIASIELAATMPEAAPHSIGIPVGERVEIVRLPPVAVLLLDVWKRKRPQDMVSTKLFVTTTGKEMDARAFLRHMQQAAAALGLEGSLADHARGFFLDSFYRHPDHAAADAAMLERHLKRFDGHYGAQTIPAAEKRLVLARTDPFPDADKSFLDDDLALADARRMRTKVPATWAACFRPKVDKGAQRLANDHPLVVELAGAELSRHNTTRGQQLLDIYLRYRKELDHGAESRKLPRRAAADVFGLAYPHYMRMVAEAKRRAGELGPKPGRCRPRIMAQMTAEEAERAGRIEAMVSPPQAKLDDFRRGLWRRQGPFVFGLSKEGKITIVEAARLLRTHKLDFVRMKLDHEAGVFEHWLRPRPSAAESRKWSVFVRAHLDEREEGQNDTDFIRALRLRHGLPIHESVAIRAIRGPAPVPATQPAHRRKDPPVPLSEDERARLAEIEAREKPAGTYARIERNARLGAEAPFVFDLVRARRLDLKTAARSLHMQDVRVGELYMLYIEGDLKMALRINTRAESRRNRELLVAELERRGAENGLGALCRGIRRRHRVYISRSAASKILYDFERKHGRKPKGTPQGKIERGPDPTLTAAEKARLKTIAGADWSGAADIAELRRSVLAKDGEFLIGLIDARKIECTEAARLTRLPAFSMIRRDFALGQAARHCEPPPAGAERRRQEDEVMRRAIVSEADGYVAFAAELPADITLAHGRIRVLRNIALEARRARAAPLVEERPAERATPPAERRDIGDTAPATGLPATEVHQLAEAAPPLAAGNGPFVDAAEPLQLDLFDLPL